MMLLENKEHSKILAWVWGTVSLLLGLCGVEQISLLFGACG